MAVLCDEHAGRDQDNDGHRQQEAICKEVGERRHGARRRRAALRQQSSPPGRGAARGTTTGPPRYLHCPDAQDRDTVGSRRHANPIQGPCPPFGLSTAEEMRRRQRPAPPGRRLRTRRFIVFSRPPRQVEACRAALLPLLRANHEDLRDISGMLEEKSYEKNDKLIEQGDAGECFWILRSGKVKVVRSAPPEDEDKDLFVRFIAEEDDDCYFGELALLEEEPRSADVIAVTSVTCWVLDHTKFREVLEKFPGVARNLLRHLATRLRHVTEVARNPKHSLATALVLGALRQSGGRSGRISGQT